MKYIVASLLIASSYGCAKNSSGTVPQLESKCALWQSMSQGPEFKILHRGLFCDFDGDNKIDQIQFQNLLLHPKGHAQLPHPTCSSNTYLRKDDPEPGCSLEEITWINGQAFFDRTLREDETTNYKGPSL
jgi:hypothetical protein